MVSAQPYFVGATSAGAGRRLLLVTSRFPPAREMGALRWEQLSAYLVEHGWRVDVVGFDPADYAHADFTRVAALSPGVRAFGVPRRPHPLERTRPSASDLRRVLGRGGLPGRAAARVLSLYLAQVKDATQRRWARDAARLGVALVREGGHVVVVTGGPPHMAHLAGPIIKAQTGIPLVADFRDPWADNPALRTAQSHAELHVVRRHEARVVADAQLLVLNTAAAHAQLTAAHPAAADRMLTVRNGADGLPSPPAPHGTRFTIGFAGRIYIDRDPEPLFRALGRVVAELGLTPDDIGIEMIGDVREFRGTPTQAIAERAGVGAFVTLGGSVPRDEALAFQGRVHMLVSLPQATLLQVPGKTFEYVNCSAWLLVFAPPESETASLLRDSDAHVVGLADVEGAAAAVRQRYLEWRAGGTPVALNADGRFGRDVQARRLLDALERIVPPGA